MFQHYFQICFLFTLHIIFSQVKYSASQENGTVEVVEPFPDILTREKCEAKLCDCEDLRKLGNVTCEDFGHKSYIFRLEFNDFKHLSARTLPGLFIDNLVLNDPDMTFDENVFEAMAGVKGFIVEQSNTEIIPDFSIVNDSIQYITIDSSQLTSLEGENLQNLKKVEKLAFRHNPISFIHPDVFKGTNNLKVLDLSHNLLTYIPQNLLDPMRNLTKFYATHNYLQHVGELFSINQPDYIYLDSNNITDVTSILQFYKEKLKKFLYDKVGYRYLTDQELGQCDPQIFDDEEADTYFNLKTLRLANNLIKEIPHSFPSCYTHKTADAYLLKINHLILSGNTLRRVNFLKYIRVVHMDLTDNQIQFLTEDDFKLAYDVSKLEFRRNQIDRVDANTFKPIRNNLQELDLSYNSMRWLNGSMKYLPLLKRLNLTHNNLQMFEEDDFCGLNDFAELYLQYNKIKSLGQLQKETKLKHLNIEYNDMRLLRIRDLPPTLLTIKLKGNPFKCNCRLEPFILRLRSNGSLSADTELCLRSELELKTPPACPDNCLCSCVDTRIISYMFVDCSSQNLSAVPQFLRDNLTKMEDNRMIMADKPHPFTVVQNAYPTIHLADRVLGIKLENNNLESLDGVVLPPNLTQLYLANNKLRRLPESVLDHQPNLKAVSLSGNPWICDCNALKFKKWLTSKHDIIEDINNTRCGTNENGESKLNGSIIWSLTDLDICPIDIGLIVSLPVGILVFVTVCLAVKLMYNKYNLNIKVFLYSHGLTFVKEEDIDHDKIFDVFLSFSHNDGEFVTRGIIEEIEKRDPNIAMCIHYRHFLPGEFIYDNIIRAVRNSKRTVIILSKNFLDSEWCLTEFRTAHVQALEDKVHRIIVIKVGDLHKEIDPAIKAYLDSTTYLTWGEKNFWNKLLYILPTGSRARYPAARDMEQNDLKKDLKTDLKCPTTEV